VPPLAERTDDIGLLTDYRISKHNVENPSPVTLDDESLQALKEYPFPGNIRELENILERATALCENDRITLKDLQLPEVTTVENDVQQNLGTMTLSIEKDEIIKSLQQHRWNQSATARALGITLRQLRYKIEKLKLNKP